MCKRLVTVGDLVIDFLLDVRLPVVADAHQESPILDMEPGGACSTLLAARNLGLEAVALGTVGDDMPGRMLLSMLDEAGVDTSALALPAGSRTTTVISLSDGETGGHVFLGYNGESPALELSDAARGKLAAADSVFMAGYSLIEERMEGLNAAVMALADEGGIPLYIDVGPLLGRLERARVEDMLKAADVLMMTDDEIQFVAPGESDIAACRRLLERFPQVLIVVKLGAGGCHILGRGIDIHCAGFAVDVVDTIGAGDAFDAAFIWAQLQGYSAADCGRIANAMGAASVKKVGAGRNVPTLGEVQEILDVNGIGINLTC